MRPQILGTPPSLRSHGARLLGQFVQGLWASPDPGQRLPTSSRAYPV